MANRVKKKGADTTPAHDSEASASIDVLAGNARGALLSFVERIERLAEEIKGGNDDLKEVFSEAKGEGFDAKILRIVIRRRAMDTAKRLEQEALIDLYESAINGPDEPFVREVQPGDTVSPEHDDDEVYDPGAEDEED